MLVDDAPGAKGADGMGAGLKGAGVGGSGLNLVKGFGGYDVDIRCRKRREGE